MEKISWRDKYLNARIYQLENLDETYSKYKYRPTIERELALLELITFELINAVLADGNYEGDSYLMAVDVIAGQIDEVATQLMLRNDEAKVELDHIADFYYEEEK